MQKPLENIIEEKIGGYMQNILEMTAMRIENIIEKMSLSLVNISLNDTLVNILKNPNNYSEYDRLKSAINTISTVSNTYLFDFESEITILDNYGGLYATWMFKYDDYNTLKSTDWYKKTFDSNGEFIWSFGRNSFNNQSNIYTVTVSRLIDEMKYKKNCGIVAISAYEINFRKILEDIDYGDTNQIMLVDGNGNVISHLDPDKIYTSIAQEEYYINNRFKKNGYTIEKIGNEKFIVNFQTIENLEWKIIQLIPYDNFFKEIQSVRKTHIYILFILMIIFVVITVIISTRITEPLNKLRSKMINLGEENMEPLLPVEGYGEIADLNFAYNKMIFKIKFLLENIKKEQKAKEELRFKALQSQINSHFILNSLNNIKYMAFFCKANSVGEMIATLGAILEESLGNEKSDTTLEEEIRYIKNYIVLREMGYENQFNVIYDIQEEVKNCIVFKFILQPIIENSLNYGLQSLKTGGKIVVSAKKNNGNVVIRVWDNGIGIDKYKLEEIRKNLNGEQPPQKVRGIGLLNIHRRITMSYGPSYGIRIESIENKGTLVEITIPYQTEEGGE